MEGKIETVCIVDDDDIYQFTASMEIQKTNLVNKIIMFPNGLKALDYINIEKDNPGNLPDVIFLDVNMPMMDGWDFLKEFIIMKANLPKSIVIFMVSSSVDSRDVDRAHEISEVSGYMVKPMGKQRLTEVFNTLLS